LVGGGVVDASPPRVLEGGGSGAGEVVQAVQVNLGIRMNWGMQPALIHQVLGLWSKPPFRSPIPPIPAIPVKRVKALNG